jgi:hypothetical protein
MWCRYIQEPMKFLLLLLFVSLSGLLRAGWVEETPFEYVEGAFHDSGNALIYIQGIDRESHHSAVLAMDSKTGLRLQGPLLPTKGETALGVSEQGELVLRKVLERGVVLRAVEFDTRRERTLEPTIAGSEIFDFFVEAEAINTVLNEYVAVVAYHRSAARDASDRYFFRYHLATGRTSVQLAERFQHNGQRYAFFPFGAQFYFLTYPTSKSIQLNKMAVNTSGRFEWQPIGKPIATPHLIYTLMVGTSQSHGKADLWVRASNRLTKWGQKPDSDLKLTVDLLSGNELDRKQVEDNRGHRFVSLPDLGWEIARDEKANAVQIRVKQ